LTTVPITPQIRDWSLISSRSAWGTYEHYMLKEICEQPQACAVFEGRIDTRPSSGAGRDRTGLPPIWLRPAALSLSAREQPSRRDGGRVPDEDLAKIPTEVEFASEFRYRNPIIGEGTVVIAISQSARPPTRWRFA